MGIKIKCHVVLAILQIQEIGRTIACCEYFHINVERYFYFTQWRILWVRKNSDKLKVDIVTRKLNGIFSLVLSLSLLLRHNHDVINQQGYFFSWAREFSSLLCSDENSVQFSLSRAWGRWWMKVRAKVKSFFCQCAGCC